MTERAIVDTGPLVAVLDASDSAHQWTIAQFRRLAPPLLTCEPVLAEAFYLLRTTRKAQEQILVWLERGVLECSFSLPAEAARVRDLWKKYASVPMSLADACLVRMSEQHDGHRLCTLDLDFAVYRRHGREPIPLLTPSAV